MASEDRRSDEQSEPEPVYKLKIVQFQGRQTPIILQNDNGPCPLLAICNVLLLRNDLNLSLDASEVSQQRLLALVAEKLLDLNSNTENRDPGYIKNQQQNISDAIDLLPRLATGIDVNVLFDSINGFEFTPECAIFDLLRIPLCHGWIIDKEDLETANAIGSKSYNTLMGELVALETRKTETIQKSDSEADCVDFAAATTAALGVPSPCLSTARSFDDTLHSESGHLRARKGDREEEAELLRALELSNTDVPTSVNEFSTEETKKNDLSASYDENTHLNSFDTGVVTDHLEVHSGGDHQFCQPEKSMTHEADASISCNSVSLSSEILPSENEHSYSKIYSGSYLDQSSCIEPGKHFISSDLEEHIGGDALAENKTEPFSNPQGDSSTGYKDDKDGPSRDQQTQETCSSSSTSPLHHEQEDDQRRCDGTFLAGTSSTRTDPDLSVSTREHIDIPKSDATSLDGSEPIYEGEECIPDSGIESYRSREPMYEGEAVLAEQAERGMVDVHPQCDIAQHNGELIRNFLRNNASQLTIYGIFALQAGLKEGTLCVFFRNNHFSTMFKFNDELYLLATDQGYMNQPDLVWEKLNEVNGDTVFMTGNFTEFDVDRRTNETWDQQNALASTADYLASIDNSPPNGSTFNSDLQLAIALQQQEFDSQPQRNQNLQQPPSGGNSRLVTGPQVQRSNPSHSSNKQESKSKDKCTVM